MQRQRSGIRNPDSVLREARMMRSLRSQNNCWVPGSNPLTLLGPGNARAGFHAICQIKAGMALGLPSSSTATKVKVASVTFSMRLVRKRWAHASMLIFIDVRPMSPIEV